MKNTYVLGMFPYPSGEGLHVGHVRIFTACDVMARYFRMKSQEDNKVSYPLGSSRALGFPSNNISYPLGSSRALGFPKEPAVLSPMGWDAFGLPAENAAIKAKKIPQEMVPHNYANFKKQMQNLSLSFDWEREFATTDPEYYAITQWIFLQLYKKGLVYREKVAINWCPKCLTGLANEEVLPDATHERCGTTVTKKLLPQWVMKITAYAERLLNDLDMDLSEWFDTDRKSSNHSPKIAQGSELGNKRTLDWPKGILEMQRNWIGKKEGMRIKFLIDKGQVTNDNTLEVFTTRVDTIDGVTFIVISPEKAKEWIDGGWDANKQVKEYIDKSLGKSEQTRLGNAGEKSGVDTLLFASNPVNNEKVPVWVADYVLSDVGTGCVMGVPYFDERDKAFAEKFNLPIKEIECDELIGQKLEKLGIAKKETTYHLRDWVFSRQRYWGEPIPLVYCEKCGDDHGVVPLPDEQLPLTLPKLESYEPTDTGESPLSRVTEWVNTTCPKCGGPARRETDTMPNWAGSCWYFLAFPFWDAKKRGEKINNLIDAKKYIKEWGPVDWYLGGAEHAVLHLLYARFWVKVLQDLGIVDFPEPFLRLRSVGLVLAEDGKKMSKSLGNVVNPDDMVAKYGSDSVRMYEMFMGPWDQSIAWDSGAISGQVRFLNRLKQVASDTKKVGDTTSPKLLAELAKLAERVERGILEQKFNTAIAGIMEFVNLWKNSDLVISKNDLQKFVQILSPFAPVTAQEIGEKDSMMGWPEFDNVQEMQTLNVTLAVQINGKLRATVQVTSDKGQVESEVMKVVMQDESVKKWLPTEPKKVIFVPGKIVNLVV